MATSILSATASLASDAFSTTASFTSTVASLAASILSATASLASDAFSTTASFTSEVVSLAVSILSATASLASDAFSTTASFTSTVASLASDASTVFSGTTFILSNIASVTSISCSCSVVSDAFFTTAPAVANPAAVVLGDTIDSAAFSNFPSVSFLASAWFLISLAIFSLAAALAASNSFFSCRLASLSF